MKRGDVIEIKLNDPVITWISGCLAVEGWAVSASPGSWGKRRWIAIKDMASKPKDLSDRFRVRFLGPCSGPKGLPGLLFDQRVTEPLTALSVTHHQSWPL